MSNSHIIPEGPTELITGPATISDLVLQLRAIDEVVLANIVYEFQAFPANPAVVTGGTFDPETILMRLKSLTVTSGTVEAIYKYKRLSVVPGSSPVNAALPVITGTAEVGETLTVSNGTWSPAATDGYEFQWYRSAEDDGTDLEEIAGETGNTYDLAAEDENMYIYASVRGINSRGTSGEVFSVATAQIVA